ncbi:hypothetical protein ACWCSD_52455 [Nonomuraea sp. NPDC001684]
MEYEFDASRTLTRFRLRDTTEVTTEDGRRIAPDTAVITWVWRPDKGWTWASASVGGLLLADENHPHVPGLQQVRTYYAFPLAENGGVLPKELEPLVQLGRPDWTPPAACTECGTPVSVAPQYDQRTGETVPLCAACHHEAVSGT